MYQCPGIHHRHNIVRCCHSLCQGESSPLFPQNINYLNFSDNTSTISWNKKSALHPLKAKALHLILCLIMMNNSVGLKEEHISGIDNDCADKLSRIYSKANSPPSFKSLFQEYPSLKEWKRFHPNPEFLSDLYTQHCWRDSLPNQVRERIWDISLTSITLQKLHK